MKILCKWDSGGSQTVRGGWSNVFRYCGHQFYFWNAEAKSAFDVFAEVEPDVFIGTTYSVDRAVFKCIASRPAMKVGMFASAWGEAADALDPVEYPIVRATEQEKSVLAALKEQTGRPDFVFIHCSDGNVGRVLGGWRGIGIEPRGVLNGADLFAYRPGTYRPELACHATMCGGYWGYKSRNLNKFILPLCQPGAGLNVKLFGHSPWPTPCYLGRLPAATESDLYASARVCMNVHEPHSTNPLYFSDIVERVFKTPCSGGLLVSDKVGEIDKVFPVGMIPMAENPSDFHDLVHFWAYASEDIRLKQIKATRDFIIGNHTYFHRVNKMLTCFGLQDEADHCERAYLSFVAKNMGL